MISFAKPVLTGKKEKKGKAVLITGLEGPYGCEMLRLPRFLDSWFPDGRKVVSLMRQPPFTA
jgi:hypothetical protein